MKKTNITHCRHHIGSAAEAKGAEDFTLPIIGILASFF